MRLPPFHIPDTPFAAVLRSPLLSLAAFSILLLGVGASAAILVEVEARVTMEASLEADADRPTAATGDSVDLVLALRQGAPLPVGASLVVAVRPLGSARPTLLHGRTLRTTGIAGTDGGIVARVAPSADLTSGTLHKGRDVELRLAGRSERLWRRLVRLVRDSPEPLAQ